MTTDTPARIPRSVLIVQSWGIGDVIMTTPMLRAARERWPSAKITLAVRSSAAAALVEGADFVDRVEIIPPQRSLAFARWAIALRARRVDVAIVATRHHVFWPRVLRVLGGIRTIAADSPSARPRWVLAHRRVALRDTEHRVESNIALLELLAGPVPRRAPRVSVLAADRARAISVIDSLRAPTDAVFLGVHTGSEPRVPQKRYPLAQMRDALVAILERDPRLQVLAFFGGELTDDRAAYRELHDRLHVVEDQPIRVVAALTGMCTAFLAGDTGLAHIAAAQGASVIVVAGPTQVQSTRPWGGNVQVITTDERLTCMPCYDTPLYGTCQHVSCMKGVPSERVARAVLGVIQGTPAARLVGLALRS
jgi:ADP-heptose:LPS heptosyltransferase